MTAELLLLAGAGLLGMLLGALLAGGALFVYYRGQQRDVEEAARRQLHQLQQGSRHVTRRYEDLRTENKRLRTENRAMNEALADQVQDLAVAKGDVKRERSNLLRMQREIDVLTGDNERLTARLEQTLVQNVELRAQFDRTVEHFTQADALRQRLLFATNKLREALQSNRQLEQRLQAIHPQTAAVSAVEEDEEEELPLEAVPEIKPYIPKLNDSGIFTLRDLLQETPRRLAELAGLESEEESGVWLNKARARLRGNGNGVQV